MYLSRETANILRTHSSTTISSNSLFPYTETRLLSSIPWFVRILHVPFLIFHCSISCPTYASDMDVVVTSLVSCLFRTCISVTSCNSYHILTTPDSIYCHAVSTSHALTRFISCPSIDFSHIQYTFITVSVSRFVHSFVSFHHSSPQ